MIRKYKGYRNKSQNVSRRSPKLYSRTEPLARERKGFPSVKIALFLFLVLVIYGVFFSPMFVVQKKVIVSSEAKKEGIMSVANSYLSGSFLASNILFLDPDRLSKKITEDRDVKEVKIEKDYLNRSIKITLLERKPAALWIEKDKKYLMDGDGILYKEIGDGEQGDLNIIKINNNIATITSKIGDKTIGNKQNKFINDLISNFKLKINEEIVSLNFENSLNEITVISSAKFKIYFDTTRDANKQIDDVVLVRKEAEKKKKKITDYIDLRVETRVFYK